MASSSLNPPKALKTFETCLQAVNDADSAQGLLDAVEDLAALNDQRSIPTLIQVLGFNNPGAAVAAVEGLVQIGIPSVSPLLEKLDGYNYGARAWAIRALAGIGDPRGQSLLLEAANDFSLSVRRAAARGLGTIRWNKVSDHERPEAMLRSQAVLLQATGDEEWVVRYAAVVGLEALAMQIAQTDLIISGLQQLRHQDDTPAVQARAQWALEKLSEKL
ncbi:HEAT repeat domain-containing protein [Leptolyngbya cf. ectocarpi LEGE 11479]|uniref:HEAT repeat domain-containing protein n=1 Tax=Leptolyngbya cf. ectocarpi LEGE 11479 TaxID=1828722 RepID=A0A929FAM2_LEPEC|nr:HEAT repeat domain-containing protein [Leptolyngbya ectocarpi]MBE9068063.1 HEAT repeat domain-containing protein [Leptolyngbya cf. ectocarpi LEGE 11479]